MKVIRLTLYILIIIFLINLFSNVYGISASFDYVITTIGIPGYNVYGQQLNEDVYYTYNVFAYGSPKDASLYASQGFALVSNGKWTSFDTKYSGMGDPGEYYYLGRDYSGNLISNVYYPVSFFPDTTPEYWNYLNVQGALESWNNKDKYKYEEQLEYMKYSKIMYDTLDFNTRTTDPYNLVHYNISANDIGLDKIMLDTCSTWKTQGILNVVRQDSNGGIRYSIFSVKPIAASASVKSNLNVEDNYTISENEAEKNIVINYGASAVNLTDYAKAKHIKEIKAELYINGEKVSSVNGSKKTDISKSYILTLNRENANSYPLYIEVKSSLYTEFAVDGLMQDGLSKVVNVTIEKYKTIIDNLHIGELSKENNQYFVSALPKFGITESANSEGIIETGKHILVKIKTDYPDDVNIYLNKEKVPNKQIYSNEGCLYFEVDIPDNSVTVASWNFLRNEIYDFFKINEQEIGKRIINPNEIKIVIREVEKRIYFDTIDNFNLNLNYTMYGVINKGEINEKIKIEKW